MLSQAAQDSFSQLRALYSQSTLLPDASASYDAERQLLVLSGYRISVGANTHVKAEKEKTNGMRQNVLVFYFQQMTYTTHQDRPAEKHAQLIIPMKSRKACKDFVRLFTQLQ